MKASSAVLLGAAAFARHAATATVFAHYMVRPSSDVPLQSYPTKGYPVI